MDLEGWEKMDTGLGPHARVGHNIMKGMLERHFGDDYEFKIVNLSSDPPRLALRLYTRRRIKA